MATGERQQWHQLFGLSWIDFFQGTGVEVQTEVDLSVKQQFLDLIFIRKGSVSISRPLPDGFDDLATYNLVTFKSFREALDSWALLELMGHYVNLRKQMSPSMDDLLPESDFRWFAVCARYPQNLADEGLLTDVREGVYNIDCLGRLIRVIVANQLPLAQHNAMLHLFSAREELLKYGREQYRPHSCDTSTLLYQLLKVYSEELDMPDKLKEFVRQTIDEILQTVSPEERLKGLPAEERLKGLPPEERLKGLPAEERLKGLPPEERLKGLAAEERLKGLSADDVLKGLNPETLEALIRKLKANGSPLTQP
jgi:hypothetical protein